MIPLLGLGVQSKEAQAFQGAMWRLERFVALFCLHLVLFGLLQVEVGTFGPKVSFRPLQYQREGQGLRSAGEGPRFGDWGVG